MTAFRCSPIAFPPRCLIGLAMIINGQCGLSKNYSEADLGINFGIGASADAVEQQVPTPFVGVRDVGVGNSHSQHVKDVGDHAHFIT